MLGDSAQSKEIVFLGGPDINVIQEVTLGSF